MVAGLKPKLHGLVFEIRYLFGYRYLDRCGQTFLDIEKNCEGWHFNGVKTQDASLHNPELDALLFFNTERFSVTSRRTFDQNIEELANHIANLWQIVKANFGLEEFERIGCRLDYLLPTPTIDDAEKITTDRSFSSEILKQFMFDDFKLKTRQLVQVIILNNREYRFSLQPVTRTESIDPGNLFRIDPRRMHEKQKKYRLELMKKLETYSQNPMYALQMDIDCGEWNPKKIYADEFIVQQVSLCNESFVPVLQQLGASI